MADVSVSPALLQGAVAMSTITTILLLVVIVAMFNPSLVTQVRAALGGAATALPGGGVGLGGLSVAVGILGAVAPDIALISGYVGDIVAGGSFRWSLTSILGVVAVVLNKLLWGYAFGGESTTADLTALGNAFRAGSAAAAPPPPSGPAATVADIASGLAAVGSAAGPVVPGLPPPPSRRAVSFGPPSVVSSLAGGLEGPAVPPGLTSPTARTTSMRRRREPDTILGGVGRALEGYPEPSRAARKPGARPAGFLPRTIYSTGGGAEQTGGARTAEIPNPCVIRGLGSLDTEASPMSMVVLSFVFIVYFLDMSWNHKRTRGELIGNFFFGLGVILMNAFALSVFSCYGSTTGSRMLPIAKALTVGLAFGGFVFLMYQNYGQQYLPVDYSAASLSPDGGGGGGGGGGGSTTNLPCPPAADGRSQTRINGVCIPNTGMSQCGGPNADDQFVCDAYKNGKKITTTIVQ